MPNAHRKELIEEYKNRKVARGVFQVTCSATGQVWAGSAPNLDARKNGLWFALNHGSNNNPTLQKAWSQHGEANFVFDILENFDDDISPMALRDALKDRLSHWAKELNAEKLLA